MLDGLMAVLRGRREVLGIASLASDGGCERWLVATSWDGVETIADVVERELRSTGDKLVVREGLEIVALGTDDRRLDVEVRRIGEVKPSATGERASALYDPQGLIEQWTRWSRGRPIPEPVLPEPGGEVVALDEALRRFQALPQGATRLGPGGEIEPLRPLLAEALRRRAAALDRSDPFAARLAERIEAALADVAPAGDGIREDLGGEAGYERFLGVADREGFAGDRVLFDRVTARLRDRTGTEPRFAVGFCLPTFDQVEGRWDVGASIRLHDLEFVPGVYVGVGVTPSDALEFWAAACVTPASGGVEWIAEHGRRDALERSAGREAFFALLDQVVDQALGERDVFHRQVESSFDETPTDPAAALRSLSLAVSARNAALRALEGTGGTSRGHLALALSRAGSDARPLVARLLARSAGRLVRRAD